MNRIVKRKSCRSGVISGLALLVAVAAGCGSGNGGGGDQTEPVLAFTQPAPDQLSSVGSVMIELPLPDGAQPESLVTALDGMPVTDAVVVADGSAHGVVNVASAGRHALTAEVEVNGQRIQTATTFETVALQNPDECEVLNQLHCLLPYPSSRFLEPADTPTGYRVSLPGSGMPVQNGAPLDPEPYKTLDGFSPVGPILMHFPGGVDIAASNAPRLSPTQNFDGRSLDPDSPTVLLDADTGERVLHFVELDARTKDTPERQFLIVHAGKSLTPGHHYIVAVRDLVRSDGSPVTAEPPFAVLRDRRPTDIGTVERRRAHFEGLFERLDEAGVAREELILAFDFVVQSDAALTGEMLSMRNQAFAWLAAQQAAGTPTFTVKAVHDFDCSAPNTFIGREITGSFQVPLFLTSDPITARAKPGTLNRAADGMPEPAGVTNPPFAFAIPCAALDDSAVALPAYVVGHAFGDSASGLIQGLIGIANIDFPFVQLPTLIAAATDWTGSTSGDFLRYLPTVFGDLNLFQSYVDRSRQAIVNTLVLTRMVKMAAFNIDPAFHTAAGDGVLASFEPSFIGRSLGGAFGTVFAALSPDVERVLLEAPAELSLFLDRSSEYALLTEGLAGLSEPLETALTVRLVDDLSARAGVAGYSTHVTTNPLPDTNAKNVLVTMALYDQESPLLGAELLARTFSIPSLEGSVTHNLPQISDRMGPQPSGLVINDIGAGNPTDPAQAPFLPPFENLGPAECNLCDPHGTTGTQVPAVAPQFIEFLSPGGVIENHCNGLCDGAEPAERAYNWPTRCTPAEPWWVPFDFCQ